jgi:hypothetical protein
MASTYGELWKKLLLYCPFVPIPLAQEWVKSRHRQLIDMASMWGGQVAESQFILPAAYSTGTVALVNSSTAVVGTGTVWTVAHVGQQLYTGGTGPYYTISAVADATHLTLERAFGGTSSASSTYEIAQCYVTPPSDFLSFKSIKDPVNNWRLRFNVSQEQLDLRDAQRSTTGDARVFADYRHSSSQIPRYEVWPRVITAKLYPFLYIKRPADLSSDSDTVMFPLRGDEVLKGALADLAMWPGTESRKNPTFNIQLANRYESEYQEMAMQLQRVDQETYLTNYIPLEESWNSGLIDSPIDAKWMQTHVDY